MSETLLPENIKKVILFPVDFFTAPNFIQRFNQQIQVFKQRIKTEEREKVKDDLNVFYMVCIKSIKDEQTQLQIHLSIFETLSTYAFHYESAETYKNVIGAFENNNLKPKLFSKFPFKSKFLYSETLFQYYNFMYSKEQSFSRENIELLLKAKYNLLRIYTQKLENRISVSNSDLSHTLTILSGCLSQLSRWFEPIYYLNIAKKEFPNNPNIDYLSALNLQTTINKTCLDYGGQSLLKIIDCCSAVIKNKAAMSQQKEQMRGIKTECLGILRKHKISVQKLRKHKQKYLQSYKKMNAYKKYCYDNQLFLNEHSFFCNCSLSTRDNIEIKTKHAHTMIQWVKQFEKVVDVLVYEFIVARRNFYFSLENTKIDNYDINSIKRSSPTENIKNVLLTNAFKSCYSILDKISFGIFQVMEIDFEKELSKKFEKGKEPKLYFLNMWEYELFNDTHFQNNFYLISLFSIAKDLDRTDFSALGKFKTIRNALEHKILYIKDDRQAYCETDIVYSKEELTEKTKLLLILTKSAILSFTYLIRNQSKKIEKQNKPVNHN